MSIGFSVQEKKRKIDFPDGSHGCHLGFLIGTILATFDLQVTLILSYLLVQKKKQKINFQDGRHLGFLIAMILAIFDVQVTLMLPTKYQVNWPRGVGGVGF